MDCFASLATTKECRTREGGYPVRRGSSVQSLLLWNAGLVVGLLWFGAMLLIASTLGAVIASRLYQVVGERVNIHLR
jgi:hypothetical protein